jgi:hypothetical protein
MSQTKINKLLELQKTLILDIEGKPFYEGFDTSVHPNNVHWNIQI